MGQTQQPLELRELSNIAQIVAEDSTGMALEFEVSNILYLDALGLRGHLASVCRFFRMLGG